jgi:hypothetical protein
MATNGSQRAWSLNSFLDSLILELDRAQDTLAVKGINRRLTYTVENLGLELQLFPEFDGGEIRFTTARPGETGAAKVSFNLGSITDRQIKEVTNEPLTADDVAITEVEGLDDETKTRLQRIGVTSAKDLERMQRKNVDLAKVSDSRVDYAKLANVINRAKRRVNAPTVAAASLTRGAEGKPVLAIQGRNLAGDRPAGDFPRAFLNGERVGVLSASSQELRLAVEPEQLRAARNELRVLLDPYAVMTMELRA